MMEVEYQERTGLQPGVTLAPVIYFEVRMTIPVKEALDAADARIRRSPTGVGYDITLGSIMPTGIVATQVMGKPGVVLRLENEPPYPGEISESGFWYQVDFTPCPVCGAPLFWYEAGYVPGYRVCTKLPHHHVLVRPR
jgi:hypothetical protein